MTPENITFSRHAKRRAKLYGIPESVIADILSKTKLKPGRQTVVKEVPDFAFPLKIVVFVEGKTMIVVTAYILKKGLKK